MIGASFRIGHDVIDVKVPYLEVVAAPGAVALLLSIERVSVRPVVREFAEVGAEGPVGAVDGDRGGQAQFLRQALSN